MKNASNSHLSIVLCVVKNIFYFDIMGRGKYFLFMEGFVVMRAQVQIFFLILAVL